MLDLVYLAWNRLEFSRFSFEAMLRHTAWEHVSRLYVYDDGSEDGTAGWLRDNLERAPVPCEFVSTEYRSPVATTNDYIRRSEAGMFAKVDNDIAVPPGWLEAMLFVMDRNPTLDLLGMEAGRTKVPTDGFHGVYGWTPSTHIGGVGLMRTAPFKRYPAPKQNGRFGFTEWQCVYRPQRGWITPDLMVCSLDFVPVEPWRSLSEGYRERGWQRPWPLYDPAAHYWDWIENLGFEAAA